LKRYFFDDFATPNRQMIFANIFCGAFMKSLIVKRSVDIDGHKTSVSLEDAFWSDLKKNRAHATSDAVEGAHGDR
jgi:Ribbon-helix-helix domain